LAASTFLDVVVADLSYETFFTASRIVCAFEPEPAAEDAAEDAAEELDVELALLDEPLAAVFDEPPPQAVPTVPMTSNAARNLDFMGSFQSNR
jgi:hypothetical protein